MKTAIRLGQWFVIGLALLSAYSIWQSARADIPVTVYQLDLMAYSTTAGHGLSLGSYMVSFRVPGYQTEAECAAAGKRTLGTFRSRVLPDGSRLLPAWSCEPVKIWVPVSTD